MRKVFKWLGIILASLVGLVMLVVAGANGMARYRMEKVNVVEVEKIAIPSDAASLERGRYLVTAMSPCIGCHGPDLSGTFLLNDPKIGQIYSANLTSGAGGIAAGFTDEDWVRVLRYGLDPDGRILIGMPANYLRHLSDADLGAVIAYVKSVPPVDKESPRRNLLFPAQVAFGLGQFGLAPAETIVKEGPLPPRPEPGVNAAYGEHISYVAACRDCHGPDLTGGNAGGPNGPRTPNLTQGGELLVWTAADFITAFRTRVTPSGHVLDEGMPVEEYQMTDDDLTALFMYLKSLPAAQTAE